MRPKNNIEVILPRIGMYRGSVCVYYKVRNPKTDSMETHRIHRGFAQCQNNIAKTKLAEKIIENYTTKLKGGWRPWADDSIIYSDQTMYAGTMLILGNVKCDGSHIKRYVSQFIDEKKLELSKKTMESYVSKLRIFVMWLDKMDMSKLRLFEITPSIINQFASYLISVRKLDKLTVEKYQQNLTQFFKWCINKKLMSDIPTVKMPKPPKSKDMGARPISDNDMKRLLDVIYDDDPQLFLACMFEYFLCCRPGSELRLMKIEDINRFTNTVHITEANGKTGARSINMPTALLDICMSFKLFDYPATHYVFGNQNKPGTIPLGKNYFSTRFRKFRDRLRLPTSYKFYSFKHTAAGKLLESGATIVEVKDHLGHKDFESTIHYIKRHFGEKSEKVTNFRPDFLKGFL